MIKLSTTKKDSPGNFKIGLFGESGDGKTRAISTLSKKDSEIFIFDVEEGTFSIADKDYARAEYNDMEGDNPLAKFASVIKYLGTEEAKAKYKWIILDSFTEFAEKLKTDMERKENWDKYGLMTKQGKFDGLAMYGELKKKLSATHDAFLNLQGYSKLVLYGATVDEKGVENKMKVLLPGSFSDIVMYKLDAFWGMKVEKDSDGNVVSRKFVTNSDGFYTAKTRVPESYPQPDLYEEAHIGNILKKCYDSKK